MSPSERGIPERITVVETEQKHIKSSLRELVETSKQTHETLLNLSRGFDNLSEAMSQLSDLEKSSSQHTDHLVRLQKIVGERDADVADLKRRLDARDKITDRVVTGAIVAGILVLYNVLPLPDFLKLMLGLIL